MDLCHLAPKICQIAELPVSARAVWGVRRPSGKQVFAWIWCERLRRDIKMADLTAYRRLASLGWAAGAERAPGTTGGMHYRRQSAC